MRKRKVRTPRLKILLIDADSTIPNIALMKISTHQKNIRNDVKLICCNIPYYPNRKKNIFNIPKGYDEIYCSVVFEGNAKYIVGEDIIFGGIGFDLTTTLPTEIEKLECDYSLYPNNDMSYGFISRGCIRNCNFCKVPAKEGWIHQVNNVSDIIKHKKVRFLDNNFLALPNHKEILQELVLSKTKLEFYQGLDIRLLDAENSYLLSQLNYLGEYVFAFDNWNYRKIIEEKLKLLTWRKQYQIKFFVYISPQMALSETIKRIEYLKRKGCLPYIMRDISCWDSKYPEFYIDIAAYCNQVHCFKKMNFSQFLKKRHIKKDRIKFSELLYYKNL